MDISHHDVYRTPLSIDMMSIGQFNGDRWIKWTRLTNLQKFLPEVVEKPKQTLKVKSENKANLEWYQSELNAEPKQIFVKSKAKSTQNKIEYYQREKRSEVKANPNQIYVKSKQSQCKIKLNMKGNSSEVKTSKLIIFYPVYLTISELQYHI